MKDLLKLVEKAIRIYNRYRAPEAIAKLVNLQDNIIEIVFEGPFYNTCGLYDWVEDMKYVLEDLGVHARLIEVKENSMHNYIGVFKIECVRERPLPCK